MRINAGSNESNCRNKLGEELKYYTDGKCTCGRVQVRYLEVGESDETVDNADTDEDEGEADSVQELYDRSVSHMVVAQRTQARERRWKTYHCSFSVGNVMFRVVDRVDEGDTSPSGKSDPCRSQYTYTHYSQGFGAGTWRSALE
jgi:hypothetical protein